MRNTFDCFVKQPNQQALNVEQRGEVQMNTTAPIEYIAAGNAQATSKELDLFAKHEDAKVRRRVAEHHNTPYELLLILVNDEHPEVRLGVANNPRATLALLQGLIEDLSVDVRFGLAENPLLPIKILTQLSKDENPYVASRARTTLS